MDFVKQVTRVQQMFLVEGFWKGSTGIFIQVIITSIASIPHMHLCSYICGYYIVCHMYYTMYHFLRVKQKRQAFCFLSHSYSK